MNYKSFKNFANGIKSIVIIIAIIVGGIWTLHVFNAELHVENAQAVLDKLKREIYKEGRLQIDLSVDQIGIGNNSERYLVINIIITNHGNDLLKIIFPYSPLAIWYVSFHDDGNITYSDPIKMQFYGTWKDDYNLITKLDAKIFDPADEKKLSFIVKVKRPGIYYIEFRGEIENRPEIFWSRGIYTIIE